MPVLTVKDLSIGYEGKVVLKGLTFSLNRGDFLSIVGENGSGKTTLMKTLLGLLPPAGGEVEFDKAFKNEGIGYLPQQSEVQKDFPASVREIVLSGCQRQKGLKPFYGLKERTLAQQAMKRIKVDHLASRCYRHLSGGQQQRVLLARAVCAAGNILLLDEPVSGLDPLVTREMYDLIDELNREGTTIIMISHDIEAALRASTHILHLGSRIFYGTVSKYMESGAGSQLTQSTMNGR